MLERIYKRAEKIASFFLEHSSEFEKVYIVSHKDTDGIAAAALLQITFSQFKKVETKIVSQIYIDTLEELKEEVGDNLVVFSDLGSSFCTAINEKFPYAIILDHHPPEDCEDSYVLNPHLFGYNGAHDLSGAGAAYFFCRDLYPEIKEYSYLAIVGAIGDKQNNPFQGLNREIIKEGKGIFHEKDGNIIIDVLEGHLRDGEYFSSLLNACGTLNKTDLGLQACRGDEVAIKKAKKVLKQYYKEINSALRRIVKNKKKIIEENKNRSAYFIVSPAQVGLTGTLSTRLIDIFNDKPVIFISKKDALKVSVRGTKQLVSQGLHLGEALKNAVGIKGEGGGHDIAAGAKYHGDIEEFIERVDFEIKKQIGDSFLIEGDLTIVYEDGKKAASIAGAIDVDNEKPLKATMIESYSNENEFITRVQSESIGTFKNVFDDILVCVKSSETIEE